MNCEDLKLNLPLYADDVLSDSELLEIEEHLPGCPLCRLTLTDYHALRSEFGALAVEELPAGLERTIKAAMSERLDSRPVLTYASTREQSIREKISHWLVPYSVGTVAASLLTLAFLFVLMSELQTSVSVLEARSRDDSPILLANSNAERVRREMSLPLEFGDVPVAVSPPKLNPAGALMALTKSIVRGDMKDEEVVVVADVFDNGLAQIAEVVDPPDDDRAMRELKKAFETEPDSAPFLPSAVKNEAGRVRVSIALVRRRQASPVRCIWRTHHGTFRSHCRGHHEARTHWA